MTCYLHQKISRVIHHDILFTPENQLQPKTLRKDCLSFQKRQYNRCPSPPKRCYLAEDYDYLSLKRGDAKPVVGGFLTKGWSSNSSAEGRSSGYFCKHLRMKSRALLDKDCGTGGSLPLPILYNARGWHGKKENVAEASVNVKSRGD